MLEVTKVFFTMEEKVKWFADNGYTVKDKEHTEWVKEYHNRTTPVKVVKPAVVFQGKEYMVEEIFDTFFKQHYKKVFTPVNLETKRKIERIIKRKKNGRI